MEGDYKEVDFDTYCPLCKDWETSVEEDPCFECLDEPVNVDSHKPVNFEEK